MNVRKCEYDSKFPFMTYLDCVGGFETMCVIERIRAQGMYLKV